MRSKINARRREISSSKIMYERQFRYSRPIDHIKLEPILNCARPAIDDLIVFLGKENANIVLFVPHGMGTVVHEHILHALE